MFPYWFLFAVFSIGALLYKARPITRDRVPLALSLATLVPVIMIGFRYRVGADWPAYMLIFSDLRFRSVLAALNRSDPAYGLLNWVVQQVNIPVWGVNLFCSAIVIYGLTRFSAQRPNPWLAFVVAVPYFLIVVAMGYTRQATAIGLIFLAFAALHERSFIRFVVWTLIAGTFHRSAVILLPIVAISYSRNRFLTGVLGLLASLLGFYFIVQPVVDVYIVRYAPGGEFESQGTGIRLAMNVLPAIFYLILQRKFQIDQEEKSVWRNLSLAALISIPLYVYLNTSTALDRLALYMLPLQILVLSSLPYTFNKDGSQNRLIAVCVIVYSAVVQGVWLNYASNAEYWLPYRFFSIF